MNDAVERRKSLMARPPGDDAAGLRSVWGLMGLAVAALYWLGSAALAWALIGAAGIASAPALIIVGGVLLWLMPGVLIVAAGVLVHEMGETRRANALVISASRLLLAPARQARGEIAQIGEELAAETEKANQVFAQARGELDRLRRDLSESLRQANSAAEVLRTETQALLARLASERESISHLSAEVTRESDSLLKALPHHSRTLSDALARTRDELARADGMVVQQTTGLEETTKRLMDRIAQIDEMGASSRNTAQALTAALTRVDEQLSRSTRMVETAVKAGDMASAASRNVADSLRDAVADALSQALKASEEITQRSEIASSQAREALSEIREAGQRAEAAVSAARIAASVYAMEAAAQRPSGLRTDPPPAQAGDGDGTVPPPAPETQGSEITGDRKVTPFRPQGIPAAVDAKNNEASSVVRQPDAPARLSWKELLGGLAGRGREQGG